MPGPFPGMDPYLEHPALWPGAHQGLISLMWENLNEILPPPYVASIGERVYVVEPYRGIIPDAIVLRRSAEPLASSGGGTAVAAAADPSWMFAVEPVEVREVYIEILAAAASDRVVTTIEVLSPSNKAAGSEGRERYEQKQAEILSSQANLLEIDLLRAGEHTVAAPLNYLMERRPWDYLVCLHRGCRRWTFEVWGIPLFQRLPRIRVPLAGDDEDVTLDLQRLLNRCYGMGAYARRIDYHDDPLPPLSPLDAEQADAILREKGLRD
ncbi:MAG TPA: DUF4058 family protein [Armatimonadota bacterium]|nr:DUF4058 family protein [Armatimonadota bacterium]